MGKISKYFRNLIEKQKQVSAKKIMTLAVG